MNAEKKLSVGVVGVGHMGSENFLPLLLAIPDVSVAWITDIDQAKAARVARAFGIRPLVLPANLKDLPYTDVVLLAIPYGSRDKYYDALHERGTAVYVLKPFARTTEEHLRLCSLFPEYNLGCGFVMRSWGPTLLLRRLVRERAFGRLRAVSYSRTGNAIVTSGTYVSDLRLAGGGPLFENGVHAIDMILYVVEAKSAVVETGSMITREGFDVHTEARLSVSGDVATDVEVQLLVSCLQEGDNGLQYVFDDAVVTTSVMGDSRLGLMTSSGERLGYVAPPDGMLYPVTAFQAFEEDWRRFIGGIRAKEASDTSAARSFLTTSVIEGLYKLGTPE